MGEKCHRMEQNFSCTFSSSCLISRRCLWHQAGHLKGHCQFKVSLENFCFKKHPKWWNLGRTNIPVSAGLWSHMPHKVRLSFLFCFCIPLPHIWPKNSREFCVHLLPSSLMKDPKDLSPPGQHLWYLEQPKRRMADLKQSGSFPQDPT